MAKFQSRWKKRTLTALSLALAASLSLGTLAACTTNEKEPEDDDTVAAATDTQRIKNGNFEFYHDKNIKNDEKTGMPLKKLNLINTPDSWTFTSGSPSSDTKSGVVNADEWDYLTKTGGYSGFTDVKVGEEDDENAETVRTFGSIADAFAHWEDKDVSAYDRLAFFYAYEDEIDDLDENSEEAKLFAKYSYSVDFEDVQKLREEIGETLPLREEVKDDESSVLMIHNSRTSDKVRGTAQYYTSSTTVTLTAGSAAKISAWVRTSNLYHYVDTELEKRGGAYISLTNTVGGTTLDPFQVKNISTEGEWKQYTFFVRASTFATTTFRLVLGLGQGSSDDRYEAVDGYAFFDDVECTLMNGSQYESEVESSGAVERLIDSLKDEKVFSVDKDGAFEGEDTFALDLYAGFDTADSFYEGVTYGLTEEISGRNTYTSAVIDPSLGANENDITRTLTMKDIAGTDNSYLKKIYENDFADKYPFGGEDANVIMLLSSNGAAYTAKISSELFTLEPEQRMLISFFVKTSEIGSGLSGASATVVDGVNKTMIGAFNSNAIAKVDIDSNSEDESMKDIYKGWTQCFFFVENDTEETKTFSLELSYGPTTIVGTNRFGYGDGYAAFTNFEFRKGLTKTEYSYASTGDRAKKVSLTGSKEETKKFDSVSATEEKKIENGLALPANFLGILGGSDYTQKNDPSVPNAKPETVDAGLLNAKYAENYYNSEEKAAWQDILDVAAGNVSTATEWWANLFGNARQPLVIVNSEPNAYGFFAETATLAANSTIRIGMRVKASVGANAYIYLTDVSAPDKAGSLIYPNLPGVTYWYDDDGNICRRDPADEDFDEETDILFEIQENGLYCRKGDSSVYYANLYNYKKDETTGNLMTKDNVVTFYEKDGKYYAAYDQKTDLYSVPVENLPLDVNGEKITRYDYRDAQLKGTQIVVKGTGDWVDVNFYLRSGDEAKEYRLEVWSGSRDGKDTNPKESYVFFDNYSSSSFSNFDDTLSGAVSDIKDKLNEEGGYTLGQDEYFGEEKNLPASYANYYTFTLYDATSYLRYDGTLDESEAGDPYSYTQSEQTEQIVSLYYYDDSNNQIAYSFFLDYTATDKTIERETPADDDHDHDQTDEDAGTVNWDQILLFISSGILAVVLVAVIVILAVRKIGKKHGKKAKVSAVKDNRIRPAKDHGDHDEE